LKIQISEIFYSLQGEGRLSGIPSVFVRLSGCPLRCRWCDTKYAWDYKAGREFEIEDVEKEISNYDTPYLVITGGEPMVHPDLEELVGKLARKGRHITIETSGIRSIRGLACDLMSISPKLSNAGGPKEWFRPDEIKKLLKDYDYQLKFVVDRPDDLDEIAVCLETLGTVEPYKVYLMPQASNRTEYLQKALWIAESCLKTGFSFSGRLQVMLWDGQRGR